MDEIADAGKPHHKYFDLPPSDSIVNQKLLTFLERIAAPEITAPRREYYQKTDLEEDKENPNLSLFMYLLSKRAQEEWITWLETFGEQEIARVFLSEEEFAEFTEFLKKSEENKEAKIDSETSRLTSIIACIPSFLNAKISELTDVNGNRSLQELNYLKDRSDLETKGRNKKDEDSDFAFLDPKRDPDFSSPLSTSNSSRGGYLFKMASRPYNLVFGIAYTDSDGKTKFNRSHPKSFKDYSTEEDIKYLLKDKNLQDLKVTVMTPTSNIQFEVDLRLTPLECKAPDPSNYLKVDNNTPVGRRLLRSLKENPYHEWKEISWQYDNDKKVALMRETPKGIFWVYLDKSEVLPKSRKQGEYPGRIHVIQPQIKEIWDMTYATRARYIVMYKVRVSDFTELPEPFNMFVKNNFSNAVNDIIAKGFKFATKSSHDDFGAIEYSFVRNDLLTVKQRYLERKKD